MKKLISSIQLPIILMVSLLVNGCALFSGGSPLPVTANDRELISSAEDFVRFNVPMITHPLNNRPIQIYKVAFDGTLNDSARIPAFEQETVVASIARRINARYYPGPGMQNRGFVNWIDAASGYTSSSIAREAEAAFFEQAAKWLEADPTTEIRVFVTGFSRGAAIGRHFMNLIAQDWAKRKELGGSSPHFYAVLFDTVSTGQMETLQLSPPSSLDYLVHFVAKDEPRLLFVPIIDREVETDMITRTYSLSGSLAPERLNLIELPGSHSDVGGAYKVGIGAVHRALSEQLLYKMGLIEQNCWGNSEEVYNGGKHDSRGIVDQIAGLPEANSSASKPRSSYKVFFTSPNFDRSVEIDTRLSAMSFANFERISGVAQITNKVLLPSFKGIRSGKNLKILSYEPSNFIDGSTFEFSNNESVRRLTYKFQEPYASRVSTLVFSDPIWKKLPEGEAATVSYSMVLRGSQTYLAAHVNNVIATSTVTNSPQPQEEAANSRRCAVDAKGNLVSPTKTFVIRATDD